LMVQKLVQMVLGFGLVLELSVAVILMKLVQRLTLVWIVVATQGPEVDVEAWHVHVEPSLQHAAH
jgi:hypothetical protein